MRRNIRIEIEYDGTRYCGWQRQGARRRFRTIQGEIERAAEKLFRRRIRLIGAGRTDSGVHAEAQVANFKIDSDLPLSNIRKGLNSYLPSDIAISSAKDAGQDFHARFHAKGKLYRYTIVNREARSPLLRQSSALVPYDLNIGAMKKAAKYLIGKKDFKSFQSGHGQKSEISYGASGKKKKDSVRTIKKLDIVKKLHIIYIYIQADGFLYNMVRNIVGTLIDVGRGRIRPETVKDILAKRHRPLAGETAPAKGLCLVKVFYPSTAPKPRLLSRG